MTYIHEFHEYYRVLRTIYITKNGQVFAAPYDPCNSCSRPPISMAFRETLSRLYRRWFLGSNIRWKALDEIYKFHILLVTLIFIFSRYMFFSFYQQTAARGAQAATCLDTRVAQNFVEHLVKISSKLTNSVINSSFWMANSYSSPS